jgi:hypothetical protein
MAIPVFPQSREAQLLGWSAQFSAKITAAATTYGLTAPMASAYAALHSSFASLYATATDTDTNSKAAITAKNVAKQSLLYGTGGAWQLVNIIQAFPGTTDAMRAELNIKIRDVEMTPSPAPEVAPDLSIVSTMGRTVRIRLRDALNTDRRGKPDNIIGATVLTYVGDEAPTDSLGWSFCLNAQHPRGPAWPTDWDWRWRRKGLRYAGNTKQRRRGICVSAFSLRNSWPFAIVEPC